MVVGNYLCFLYYIDDFDGFSQNYRFYLQTEIILTNCILVRELEVPSTPNAQKLGTATLTLSQGHAQNRSARLLRLFGSGGCRAKTMWAFDPSRTQPGVALIYFANSSAGSCRSVHLCRDSNYFQCHIRNPTRVPWQCSLSTCC